MLRILILRGALLLGLSTLTLATSGCAGWYSFIGKTPPKTYYPPTADENLERGEKALKLKRFPEAASYFENTRSKFPYTDAAKIAELRLADIDYENNATIEAREKYRTFLRGNPTSPQADYAAYRVALTHYREMPSTLFILPPAEEKEQREVLDAEAALNDFILNNPGSKYVEPARRVLQNVRQRLVAHELYAARFYAKRKRWSAVVGRLTYAIRRYEAGNKPGKVYLELATAYTKLKDNTNARSTLESYLEKYPNDGDASKARALLASVPQ